MAPPSLRSRQEDYDLVAAPSGTAALAMLAERPVDLVITDLWMHDMDGVALTEAVKNLAPDCQVILLAARPMVFDLQRAWAAGVADVVSKPVPLGTFATTVRTALGQ